MRLVEEYMIYVKREIKNKFDTWVKKCTRNYKGGGLKEGER